MKLNWNNIVESLKRLLIPKYTDKKVQKIQDETIKMLEESEEQSRRYNQLLKANGVVMRIAIATGHGDRKK